MPNTQQLFYKVFLVLQKYIPNFTTIIYSTVPSIFGSVNLKDSRNLHCVKNSKYGVFLVRILPYLN